MRFRARLFRCTVLLLGWLASLHGVQAQTRAAEPPLTLAQSAGLALDSALLGILTYTRWPTPPDPLRLCVMGSSPSASRLLQRGLPQPEGLPAVKVRGIAPDPGAVEECDALYVGQLDDGTWRALLPHLFARPLLTVCERSPVCASGGMFCLDIDTAGHVQFEVNLDSVARSQIRVHPQVLRLGRRKGAVQ